LATVIGRRLTTEGCDLVIAARTAVDLENEATRLRTDTGRRVEVEAVDLSDGDQVIALAQGHGDVDVLIDNAGALPGGQVLDIDEATWRKAHVFKRDRSHRWTETAGPQTREDIEHLFIDAHEKKSTSPREFARYPGI
jgi:NAD(P)-dependent dehydrogenase (short-subunit alcohol dehydrogenase family)